MVEYLTGRQLKMLVWTTMTQRRLQEQLRRTGLGRAAPRARSSYEVMMAAGMGAFFSHHCDSLDRAAPTAGVYVPLNIRVPDELN